MPLPMSGEVPNQHRPAFCKNCDGTRGQHWAEGCQCRRCEFKPDHEKCRSYEPDYDRAPVKRANGRKGGLASRRDSPVQIAAAKDVEEPKLGTRRREALDVIRASGPKGVTFDELCSTIGRNYSQTGPRVRELVADGWVRKAQRTRKGASGAEQEVWIAAGYAEDFRSNS